MITKMYNTNKSTYRRAKQSVVVEKQPLLYCVRRALAPQREECWVPVQGLHHWNITGSALWDVPKMLWCHFQAAAGGVLQTVCCPRESDVFRDSRVAGFPS